ncbi:condensation domain-containing protein [Streptomyces sp. LZ34]
MRNSTEPRLRQLTPPQRVHFRRFPPDSESRTAIWRQQKIAGPLDVRSFKEALRNVVREHEALRLSFIPAQGVLHQWVRDTPSAQHLIAAQNIRSSSQGQFDRYVGRFLASEMRRSWDLGSEYPFRFFLLRHSPDLHVFLAGFTHAAIDGRSCDIILRDLWRTYEACRDVGPAPCAEESSQRPGKSPVPGVENTREDIRKQAATYWSKRFASVPPFIQIWGRNGPPPVHDQSAGLAQADKPYRVFKVAGTPLHTMRNHVRTSGCTEFKWILAVFAATLFSLSPQDRIKISVLVDIRGSAEREAVGMFAMRIPVIIERQSTRANAIAHVHRELISSIAAYKRMDPEELNHALRDDGEKLGTSTVDDVSINYRVMSDALPTMGTDGITVSAYESPHSPELKFEPYGLDLKVFSSPDALHYHFLAHDAVFPPWLQDQFSASFEAALAEGGGLTPDEPIPKDRSVVEGSGFDLITDADGKVVVAVDTRRIAESLLQVEGVVAAEAIVLKDEHGLDVLQARVATDREVPEHVLRAHVKDSSNGSRFIMVPKSIIYESVSPDRQHH